MKIAVVNDSPTALKRLCDIVQAEDMTVLWTALDGSEAVEKCRIDRPDMILMDIVMPGVDGVEATRRIMSETPCPILLVTAFIGDNVSAVFKAMGAGALDVVATPPLGAEEARRLLLAKIRSLAFLSNLTPSRNPTLGTKQSPKRLDACVLVGASAGGPAALATIIKALPADLRAAVVIVQHVDERFSSDLASWLGTEAALTVKLAAEGDELREGQILIAKGGQHLVFGRDRRLHYKEEPKLSYQPSVDVLFESAIRHGPRNLLGVLLTGMGRDGAAGLKKLRKAGHPTIAQDKATSAIYGMPRAAAEIDAASEILPLQKIAPRMIEWSIQNA